MGYIFNKITALFSLILYPFRNLPPVVGLAFLALLTAVFALLVYKTVSNQTAIKIRKKRIIGHFFGIYLFRDDLGLIIREFGRVMLSVFRYLGYVLPPLLVIIVPVLLLCAQIQIRYGYRSPRPGEEVNITLRLAPEVNILRTKIELNAPAGVAFQTPPLRIKALREAAWRIEIGEEGDHTLTFTVGESVLTKNLRAIERIGRIYPETKRSSLLSILASPGEKIIPDDSPIISARIDYPTREINFFGLRLHWSIIFLILALAFGLILKKPLRVDF